MKTAFRLAVSSALVCIAVQSADAQAVKYYARERIVGLALSNAQAPTTPTAPTTYSWKTGDWTPANAVCPDPQTRTVSCVGSDGSVASDESSCSAAGAKPDASQSAACQNMLSNPSFENGTIAPFSPGANIRIASGVAHTGTYSVNDNNQAITYAPVTAVSGRTYRFSAWVLQNSYCSSISTISVGNYAYNTSSSFSCPKSWTRVSAEIVANSSKALRLSLSGDVYVDDVELILVR